MTIPIEFLQLAGAGLFGVTCWVLGVKWGRANPDKVEALNAQLKALEQAVRK